jgi:hypothetical protein
MKDIVPTNEQQVALVNDVKERLNARSRSWLEDRTVKAALQRFDPAECEPRKAG